MRHCDDTTIWVNGSAPVAEPRAKPNFDHTRPIHPLHGLISTLPNHINAYKRFPAQQPIPSAHTHHTPLLQMQPTMQRSQTAFSCGAPARRLNIAPHRPQFRRLMVAGAAAAADSTTNTAPLWEELRESAAAFRKAPISMVRDTFPTVSLSTICNSNT